MRFRRLPPAVLACSTLWCMAACQAQVPSAADTVAVSGLMNYGSGKSVWTDKLQALSRGKNEKLRILQIGDSHTAGDYFTHALRQNLQQRFGNGGIGWVYPQRVNGQRQAQIEYSGEGWDILSSRNRTDDFPLGGIIARSKGGSAGLNPRQAQTDTADITFVIRPVLASAPLRVSDAYGQTVAEWSAHAVGSWQYHSVQAALPIRYHAQADDVWDVGHINIENKQPGVIVSAMGINGAQLSHWQRWRSDWAQDLAATRADLVILAYGTNEAFDKQLDLAATAQTLRERITQIRRALPKADVLIVGAPESLQNKGSQGCSSRPAMLDAVQQLQQDIARTQQTWYWSWQDAMGGRCSMKSWMSQGLAARDAVHFSADGYRRAGGALAEALAAQVGKH
ncbi:lysophospholipase L1-like esterase [Neisseria sp. HSC-16F19]|nr:GDSL-type esterase/lipase family protein [Neisseria sp. HSC-16F19]MCP2041518.1 lysophospholipase L1-like esterase [Neisseria sp. HSC-16F19]